MFWFLNCICRFFSLDYIFHCAIFIFSFPCIFSLCEIVSYSYVFSLRVCFHVSFPCMPPSPYTSLFYSVSVIFANTIYLPIMLFSLSLPHISLSVCVPTPGVCPHFVCLYSMYVPSLYKSYISFPCVPTSRVCLHSICPLPVCVPILCLSLLHECPLHVCPHSKCVPSPCKSYIPFPCVSPLHV